MRELISKAWSADPVVAFCAVVAIVTVLFGGLLRAKGPDARFAIDVFAYFATIASVFKFFKWSLQRLAHDQSAVESPSGTDILLLMGSISAIFLVSIQGIGSLFERQPDDKISPLGQFLIYVGVDHLLPPKVRKSLGIKGNHVAGEIAESQRSSEIGRS